MRFPASAYDPTPCAWPGFDEAIEYDEPALRVNG